jgi:hypothetical protein
MTEGIGAGGHGVTVGQLHIFSCPEAPGRPSGHGNFGTFDFGNFNDPRRFGSSGADGTMEIRTARKRNMARLLFFICVAPYL